MARKKTPGIPLAMTTNMWIGLRLIGSHYLWERAWPDPDHEPKEYEKVCAVEKLYEELPGDWPATEGPNRRRAYGGRRGRALKRRQKMHLRPEQVEPMLDLLRYAVSVPGGFMDNLVSGYHMRIAQLEKLDLITIMGLLA